MVITKHNTIQSGRSSSVHVNLCVTFFAGAMYDKCWWQYKSLNIGNKFTRHDKEHVHIGITFSVGAGKKNIDTVSIHGS